MCLSIRQPYASWLCNPQRFIDADLPPKRVENRDWTTKYRGPLLIHAAKIFEVGARSYWLHHLPGLERAVSMNPQDYPRGAIIGVAHLTAVLIEHDGDIWFRGPYGFILQNARLFEKPVGYRGLPGMFPVPVERVPEALKVVQR